MVVQSRSKWKHRALSLARASRWLVVNPVGKQSRAWCSSGRRVGGMARQSLLEVHDDAKQS